MSMNNQTNNQINKQKEIKNTNVKTLSIIINGEIRNVVLDDFKKEKITFGRDPTNDIVLSSHFVSKFHGYFELKNNELIIVDNESKNGLIINEEKVNQRVLEDNDYIRIDNARERLVTGVLILVTFNKIVRKWTKYKLDDTKTNIIGNTPNSNIFLNIQSKENKNIEIVKENNEFIIKSSNEKIYINNSEIKGRYILKDNDIINIAGIHLIYYQSEMFYQFTELGVRVDARGIYKIVRVKGKKRTISEDVNMTINPGEFVAFVGGSGAGKSTFMSFLCGLSKPTKGNVYINGKDLFANYDELKEIIGYVPQDDIVFTNLTLIDMLTYSAEFRMPKKSTPVEKERRIKEVLQTVGLVGKENVMIKNLSGGQRKRAGIAIELLADPKLFFLDEPTSGLDPGTERNMMKTLRKIADSGQTVILVTHNTLNIHLCDKVVFFGDGGRVCYDGSPENAKAFFGVNDFVDIYNLISDEPEKWYNKQKELTKLDAIEVKNTETPAEKLKKLNERKKQKHSSIKQFATLVKRQLKTIINNKFQLALLLFQAPIIAFALTLVINNQMFEYYDMTKSILFSISIAAIYIGLGNSIQEICKEKVILKKEYMSNLRLSAYVLSKVFILLILSAIQAFLLIFTLKCLIEVPTDGVIFSWDVEMTIECALTIFCSSTIGLVVSSISSDASIAMTYIPLLLVPQMLFSGMLFELKGLTDKLSNIILCRWSLELLGTTNDMNNMVSLIQDVIPEYKREAEVFYEFTSKHFYNNVFIIIFMSFVLIAACYIILKRQLEVKK